MECLTNALSEIDKILLKGLRIDTMKSYGIVTRHYDYNGKIINMSDNPTDVNEGEITYWDDAFQTVWFHRINQVNNERTNTGYGRNKFGLREKSNISLVIWSKRKLTWNGEYTEIKQPELYRNFANILSHYTIAQISSIDFDITQIEQGEFMKGFTQKDCILLRINYELEYDLPKNCLDCTQTNDCK